jgi:hypothetical protein
MVLRRFTPFLLLVAAAACSEKVTAPSDTGTSTPPVEIPAAPVARLAVTVDARQSLVAIQSLSDVKLDAGGSSGTGLRYSLDFGDGQGVDQPIAQHIYQTGGKTYRLRAIVTDAHGRTDTATTELTVTNVEGRWFHAFFNPNADRYERRTLDIVAQNGRALQGVYTHPEGFTSSFGGELWGERELTLVLAAITFRSEPNTGFASDAMRFSVRMHGGSANGFTLVFAR